MMAGIRSKDTKPELAVRSFLHAHGFRFRLHYRNLPGRPDIVLPKWHVAIFVHGCFWHQHTGCAKATTPSTNVDKWQTKFAANLERDNKVFAELDALGWNVIVIWECGIGRSVSPQSLGLERLCDAIMRPRQHFVEWPEKPL